MAVDSSPSRRPPPLHLSVITTTAGFVLFLLMSFVLFRDQNPKHFLVVITRIPIGDSSESSDSSVDENRRLMYQPTIITESRLHLCPIASLVVPTPLPPPIMRWVISPSPVAAAPSHHVHHRHARCSRLLHARARAAAMRARRRVGRPPKARKQRHPSFKRMRARNLLTV